MGESLSNAINGIKEAPGKALEYVEGKASEGVNFVSKALNDGSALDTKNKEDPQRNFKERILGKKSEYATALNNAISKQPFSSNVVQLNASQNMLADLEQKAKDSSNQPIIIDQSKTIRSNNSQSDSGIRLPARNYEPLQMVSFQSAPTPTKSKIDWMHSAGIQAGKVIY